MFRSDGKGVGQVTVNRRASDGAEPEGKPSTTVMSCGKRQMSFFCLSSHPQIQKSIGVELLLLRFKKEPADQDASRAFSFEGSSNREETLG